MSELAQLVASLATLVTSVAVLIQALRIKREVKTANALTLAQLGDQGETRRIQAKDPTDITAAEHRHLGDVPPLESP
jgi:hypothetical protein